MSAAIPDLDLMRVTLALAFAAYDDDSVRFASRSLAGATHIVATRKGLYAINEEEWTLIAHGFFFGVTIRGEDIFAFEACDQPHSFLQRGRIVRLTRSGTEIVSGTVVAKGLDNGCHQIDFLRNRLHVVDTYQQTVLRFTEDMSAYETLTPLPTAPNGRWDNRDPEYVHVNSILEVGERVLLLLHNGSEHTGRKSEIAVYGQDWQPVERWELDGRSCHGFAVLEDGSLLTCDSIAGDIISTAGFRAHVTPYLTRGLAIGEDGIVVGGSRLAKRDERLTSSGTVTFLDRDYTVRSVMELPGGPTEIRRLDGRDYGLSDYLRWGDGR